MTEKLLQFIWQFQYFNRAQLQTTAGDGLEIVFPGKPNDNQGPDFSNARIRVGATLFAGSVELHLKTSDWVRHGHGRDANYTNVILHVVLHHDSGFQNGIPVLELQHRIPALLLDRYDFLMRGLSLYPAPALLRKHAN